MVITGAKIVTDGCVIDGKDVVIKNGVIEDVRDHIMFEGDAVDLGGCYITPGFTDLHCHGGDGYEFIDATEEAFIHACKVHADHGTRVIYPTISATDFNTLEKCLLVAERMKKDCGIEINGLHLEGPYLSPEMCGAQDTMYMHAPDPKEYLPLLKHYSHMIARWTYAPETDNGEFLSALNEYGVVASVGHSNASYEHMLPAYENRCRLATHLYSSMSTITRRGGFRHLGIIECAYLFDDMFTEVIGDGCHIPPELLRLILKIKTTDRVCLITDAIRFAGMESAENKIGGTERIPYVIEDGVAKLADRSGFAGSIVTMDQIVRRLNAVGFEIPQIIRMMTETPAHAMGLKNYGRITSGYRALFTILDEKLNVVHSFHRIDKA